MDEPNKPSLREKLADAVDISKDVILDTALIRMIGSRELTIENYKGIVEYTERCIRVKTKQNMLKVTGTNLEIKTITQELLYITGRITCFSFES